MLSFLATLVRWYWGRLLRRRLEYGDSGPPSGVAFVWKDEGLENLMQTVNTTVSMAPGSTVVERILPWAESGPQGKVCHLAGSRLSEGVSRTAEQRHLRRGFHYSASPIQPPRQERAVTMQSVICSTTTSSREFLSGSRGIRTVSIPQHHRGRSHRWEKREKRPEG